MSCGHTTIVALVLGLVPGCFIEQLPSSKDTGSGDGGQTPAVRSLAVGNGTTCAVLATGAVRCWGNEIVGLGGVYGHRTLRPVALTALAGVEAIAIAPYHGCALIAGSVSCYGSNDQGQVGNGQTGGMDLPLKPTVGGSGVAQISVASSVSSARTTAGTVLTWGAGFVGFGAAMPTAVSGIVAATDLSISGDHDCAVSGGQVSCWGWSTRGQLGRGTVPNPVTVEQPGPVIGVTDATQVVTGSDNCVVHADATVSCWGGAPANPPQPTPTLVAGLSGVQKLVAGDDHRYPLR